MTIPARIEQDKISIHAPARGATQCYKHWGLCFLYFNPRTREGCDFGLRSRKHRGQLISIHAPARGATNYCGDFNLAFTISIHAPARGATLTHKKYFMTTSHFNPRTREGCDLDEWLERGGTRYFNPRTREGCDSQSWVSGDHSRAFQSTHPRGVRRIGNYDFKGYQGISIHAPARGATRSNKGKTNMLRISIHAPARGATPMHRYAAASFGHFNPRTREGCDSAG